MQIVLLVRFEFGEKLVDLAQWQRRHAIHFGDLVFVRLASEMAALRISRGERTSMTLMPRPGLSSAFFISCTVTSSGLPTGSAGTGAMTLN
jgi:hypothetical protein